MQAPVAVYDALPVFRLGLLAALGEGGIELSTEAELRRWSPPQGGVLLLSTSEDEIVSAPARTGPTVQVVAVLDEITDLGAARALRAGAVNIVARDAPAEEFRRVVSEVRAGSVTLSISTLRAALVAPEVARGGASLADDELLWLRTLAAGHSIAELAAAASYSERMMYRKLRDLYARMGVSNRTQALVRARGEGWL